MSKNRIRDRLLGRLSSFKTEVLSAYKAGKQAVYFGRRCIPFEGHPDRFDTMLEVTIEGTVYSLADGLRNAARLAERGYLGRDLELFGVQLMADMAVADERHEAVAEMRRRTAEKKAARKARQDALRVHLARLWPAELVERVLQWDTFKNDRVHADWVAGGKQGEPVYDRSARSAVVAADVLAVLAHVKAGGAVPETYQDAVGLGLDLRFVTPERWEAVKILANVLAWTKPKHRKPGAGARKRRADEHWRRNETAKDQEGARGTSDPV